MLRIPIRYLGNLNIKDVIFIFFPLNKYAQIQGRRRNKEMRLKYVTEAHGASKLRAEITPISVRKPLRKR
jgi:hypothetical protein